MESNETPQIKETPLHKSIFYFLPLIFIIIIIPLITYGKIVELPLAEANFWKGGSTHVDFFSYYKSTFLIIAACMALLSYGMLILNHSITLQNEKKYYIPMIFYCVFVVLSSIFSPYRNVALLGFIDMYQGMSVLLSYILIAFIMMNFLSTERDIKVIINSFVILAIIVGILGLSQYFGYDLLQTDIGKKLISPEIIENANIKFTFGKYTIYATMYNTNFVGSFGALVLPLTAMLFLNADNKKTETIFLLSTILSYTTWLGCNSRAGYLGIITASFLGTIMFLKLLKKKYKKLILLMIIYLAVTIIFNLASGGKVLSQFSRLSPLAEAKNLKQLQQEQEVQFTDISVNLNTFTIETTTEKLTGIIENNEDYNLKFIDINGEELETTTDNENKITFKDTRYSGYIFKKVAGSPFIKAYIYKRPLNFYFTEDSVVKVISMNYKLTEPVTAPRIKIFDGRETFASNRGYIWSRTIPMLKDTMVIGYGPDNYCLMFPQEDYVGRFNTGIGMTNIVVDKPHNLYLQTAVNTGVISLLALVVLWSIYIFDCIKLYKNLELNTFAEQIGAATFLSITAYLAAGMFNDNIVSVAPIFWILLGLGISINRMIKIDNFQIEC
jgi:hypothetical protein